MIVGIIGSGLTGLTAAYMLADNVSCTIFEKKHEIGGCLSSVNYGTYTLETLYHHCFSGDTELLALLDKLGLKHELLWLKGSTGYFAKGKLEPVTTPKEIFKWEALTLLQKIKLGWFVLHSHHINTDLLDTITAETYLQKKVGNRIYRAFFMPLLRSKFGDQAKTVSASWLMSRIAIRSDRGTDGERLGYLKGGWGRFIEALSTALQQKNCTILCDTPVKSIEFRDNKWIINDQEFDAVISTIPPQILRTFIKGSTNLATTLKDIPYQGSACMTIGMKRDPCNGIYWTNMGDEAPYGAVVVHTNFAPFEWYGEHVVYLASYFTKEPSKTLKADMLEDFCTRFKIPHTEITHADLYLEPMAGPIFKTGYKSQISPITIGPNFFSVGMFSPENYPERSMEGSIKAGIHAASLIKQI